MCALLGLDQTEPHFPAKDEAPNMISGPVGIFGFEGCAADALLSGPLQPLDIEGQGEQGLESCALQQQKTRWQPPACFWQQYFIIVTCDHQKHHGPRHGAFAS